MDKDEIKHIIKSVAGGKDIISGIHNYCDRWCDRCTHTSHCSVFKIEQGMSRTNEELDIHNEKFWNSLNEMFKATTEAMEQSVQKFNIDPNIEIPADDFISKSISSKMVVISRNYAMDVAKWIDQNRDIILERFTLLQNINVDNAHLFSETVDVIQHYFMLVATKTYRASLVFDDENDETDDARGSAKVTIIVIDRSISAWSVLLNHFPSNEDDILQFLKTLAKVKRLILVAFPTAMEFVRPGFDE